MTSSLPFRKNIEPLSKIVSDLEKIKITSRDVKGGRKNLNKYGPTINAENNKIHYISLIEAKDKQIDKLVEKLSMLYNYNNQYAVDNDKLRKELLLLQQNFDSLKSLACDNCDALAQNREQHIKENVELKDDIKMMKTLVYRLNVQLEHNQEFLRKLNHKDKHINKIDFDSQTTKNELNWGDVNSHTLGPLLNAYQEFISDKNDLIQHYENEINNFTGNFKEVIEENNNLHLQISNLNKTHDNWNADRTRIQAQLEICQNKAEIQTRRADLAKEKLVEVMKCYEKKIQAQILDIERLQEAYGRTKNELTTLRSLHQQPEVVVESLRECQKLFEELKLQHDNEKKRLLVEIEELKKSSTEDGKSSSNLKSNYLELQNIITKQKEMNNVLAEKNTTLRHNLSRIRRSRESLKKRLKVSVGYAKHQEDSQHRIKNSWNDLNQIQGFMHQKENQMKTMQMRHLAEVEVLTRKLRQREDTLKKILQDRVNSKLRSKNI